MWGFNWKSRHVTQINFRSEYLVDHGDSMSWLLSFYYEHESPSTTNSNCPNQNINPQEMIGVLCRLLNCHRCGFTIFPSVYIYIYKFKESSKYSKSSLLKWLFNCDQFYWRRVESNFFFPYLNLMNENIWYKNFLISDIAKKLIIIRWRS